MSDIFDILIVYVIQYKHGFVLLCCVYMMAFVASSKLLTYFCQNCFAAVGLGYGCLFLLYFCPSTSQVNITVGDMTTPQQTTTKRPPCAQRLGPTWWRHQMKKFSALLAFCTGNSPVPGEFPTQRPVTRSFEVFFDLRPNKRLSKQSWGWWYETPLSSLWRHRNVKV